MLDSGLSPSRGRRRRPGPSGAGPGRRACTTPAR